jgi:RNA polymerase sigma factor (sigma-70 family)
VSNAKHHSREFSPEGTARVLESALWGAFKKGDEKALISIFDRYANVLYNYGVKVYNDGESVKDAVQDLFIELWRNRENLSDTDSIKFYLFKALRLKLLRVKRSKARRDFLRLSQTDDSFSPSHEFFVIAEQALSEQRQRLMKMLDGLTPRQREAIFLRYFEEMSYERIAGIMEMNKQSVYNLIHAGIYQLRESL